MLWSLELLKKCMGKICNLISELSPDFGIGRFVVEETTNYVEIRLHAEGRNAGVLVYKV